ncbi:MAG: matrixin family metalloprotease [Acidobacteria bacterium]|nr:matrixin family metalloprotease [Acidobacteriota bacterium]
MIAFQRIQRVLWFALAAVLAGCGGGPPPGRKAAPPPALAAPKPPPRPPVVGLIPLGPVEPDLLPLLAEELGRFYGARVIRYQSLSLPEEAYYPPRNRYRADILLAWLDRNRPPGCDHFLWVTAADISCTKGPYADWGIFGFGYMPGPSCVVSTFRLNRNTRSPDHFRERLVKVALHEVGHNLGLDHCPDKNCLMVDAEGTMAAVDREHKALCAACRAKLADSANR